MTIDLIIRNASLDGSEELVDIGINDGYVDDVTKSAGETGHREIDAAGNFVSPGFVDCHRHIDRSFASAGGQVPRGNDEQGRVAGWNQLFDEFHVDTPVDEIEENAVRAIQRSVAAGTTHLRSHVAVDHPTTTKNMEACLNAMALTEDIVDLEFVPMLSRGILHDKTAEQHLRDAIQMVLDEDPTGGSVLVGGVDPATRNNDIERTMDKWFSLAAEFDIDIDVHIQDSGTLGVYTIERLLAKIAEFGYQGRVSASHSFSLAHVPDWKLEQIIPRIVDAGLKLVTCYNSTRCEMPIRKLVTNGVTVGHGTDNDQDFVLPLGDPDVLVGAFVEVCKLHGDRDLDELYRWYETNPGLALIWDLITEQGAEVLRLDDYGIAEGNPADIVIFDEPSPQWTIINRATRSFVIKDGAVVAEDEELLPEYKVVD